MPPRQPTGSGRSLLLALLLLTFKGTSMYGVEDLVAARGSHLTCLLQRYRDRLEADARSWDISPMTAWLLRLLPLFGVVTFLDREFSDALLTEDGVVETTYVTNRSAEYSELIFFYSAVLAMVWLGHRRWAEGDGTVQALAQARPRST